MTSHFTYDVGAYDLPLTEEQALECLRDLIGRNIHLPKTEPQPIGSIADMYGHPLTGWPADDPKAATATGCLPLGLALGGAAATAAAAFGLLLR